MRILLTSIIALFFGIVGAIIGALLLGGTSVALPGLGLIIAGSLIGAIFGFFVGALIGIFVGLLISRRFASRNY